MLRLLRFPIFLLLSFLALMLFPLWGPFACFYLARAIAKRMPRHPGILAMLAAFAAQLALFTPILVSKSSGMMVVFPWWVMIFTNSSDHIDFTIGYGSVLLFLIISIVAINRVRRQAKAADASAIPETLATLEACPAKPDQEP